MDIDKLKVTPIHLNKLRNLAKNLVDPKTVYNELIKKVNATQTNDTIDLV